MAQPNLAQQKNEFDKLEYDKFDLDRFHNSKLADKIQASRLLGSRFGAANINRELDDSEAANTNQEIPQYKQRNPRTPDIPSNRQRLESPEQLNSLVEGLEANMTEEQGREYGERLGAYLNKKINEGSFAAMLVGFMLSITIDMLDSTAGWVLDFGIPIIGSILEWTVEMIFYVALIFVIRKQISFFKRGLFKLIIRIILIPMFIEAIPILEGISPTYTIMMLYVYYKHRKDIKTIQFSYLKVQNLVKKQLSPRAKRKMSSYIQKTKLAA
jgi:hypothetical protein